MGRNWLSLFSAAEGRAVQITLTVGSFELSLLAESSGLKRPLRRSVKSLGFAESGGEGGN
jgi:hypothetical protein